MAELDPKEGLKRPRREPWDGIEGVGTIDHNGPGTVREDRPTGARPDADRTENSSGERTDGMTEVRSITEAIDWRKDYTTARDDARRLDRPLFIDFWEPGCYGCARLAAETYPNPEVQRVLNERLVPLKINEADPGPEGGRLITRYRLLWTPGLLYLDGRGAELDRAVGFLSPDEFVAQADFVLGKAAYLRQRWREAENAFRRAHDRSGVSELAAKALFWSGLARYKASGSVKEVLDRAWDELRESFPESGWTRRADVFGYHHPDPATIF